MYVSRELDADTSQRRRYGIHSRVVEGCQQISGLLADTMSHDSGYHFFRIGRALERADMTTRIIDVAAATLSNRDDLARFDNTLWMAVLQSLSAYQMYRQKVRRRISSNDVIEYLLKDEQFPRAFSFSLRELGAALALLPRNAEPQKKLGALRRMLAQLKVARVDIAEHAPVDRRRAAQSRRAAHADASHLVRAVRGDGADDELGRRDAVSIPVANANRKPNAVERLSGYRPC